jgi:hypothetical protein
VGQLTPDAPTYPHPVPTIDLVVEAHNLLDGTWRVASKTLDENKQEPAVGSIASAEIATDETGPGGPWGEEPALTAYSLATIANFAAADHLGCLATLVDSGGVAGIFGPLVIARACIEASARSWWLLDRNITVRERVGRSFRIRIRSIDETVHLIDELLLGLHPGERDAGRNQLLDDREAQRVRRSALLSQAVARGIPLHYEKGVPNGINVTMPKNDEVVGALLQDAGAALGTALYALLSGVTHATHYALLQYFEQTEIGDRHLAQLEPVLRNESLLSTVTVVLLAFVTSFGRLVDLYGWESRTWDAWVHHVKKKIVEFHSAGTA